MPLPFQLPAEGKLDTKALSTKLGEAIRTEVDYLSKITGAQIVRGRDPISGDCRKLPADREVMPLFRNDSKIRS